MNFTKGINNLFSLTYINFILALCLIIILILIYFRTKKLDLFDPTVGGDISSQLSSNNYLTSFIKNYINKNQQQNANMEILAKQEKTIQTLSQKVINLINPSS